MFLIDKYRITNIYNILYHKEIYEKLFEKKDYNLLLDQISNNKKVKIKDVVCGDYNNFPNIFIHGPPSSGKKTLINLILKDMFGDEIYKIKKEEYSIMLFGNKKETIILDQSKHHIIINPTNSAFDRYLIQDIVKTYCSQFTLDMVKNKNRFKVVVINNIDKLSYYAQTSLRCSMERYIHNCKFILSGYNLSKVIDPLKGRCLLIRLPKPSNSDIFKLLLNVSSRENKILKREEYMQIVNSAERDPKLALWLLENKYMGLNLELVFWKNNIKQVVDIIINIIKNKNVELTELMGIRKLIYEVYITNIDENNIMNELFFELNNKLKDNKILISKLFRKYDYRNIIGKRLMIQLEALIFNLIRELIKEEATIRQKAII
jgi:replication factor C subunit 3/5